MAMSLQYTDAESVVTPEMIKAGIAALHLWDAGREDETTVVMEIYRAMVKTQTKPYNTEWNTLTKLEWHHTGNKDDGFSLQNVAQPHMDDNYIIKQHIDTLKSLIQGMHADNWGHTREHCASELVELSRVIEWERTSSIRWRTG